MKCFEGRSGRELLQRRKKKKKAELAKLMREWETETKLRIWGLNATGWGSADLPGVNILILHYKPKLMGLTLRSGVKLSKY